METLGKSYDPASKGFFLGYRRGVLRVSLQVP